jgi:glycosyltransferase involved in cell wall biosynthesis
VTASFVRAEDQVGAQAGPEITVIVPVYNGAFVLEQCLAALGRSQDVVWECIVVDDGSTDASGAIARAWGAQVLQSDAPRSGPGRARNRGASLATAPLLCFVDADVVVRPDTLARFVALFSAESDVAAVFGSYDTQPRDGGLLSQYRNLLHHYVHQTGREEASTFWAGCGAIRRDAFLALGGFDAGYTRPSIEDIELGYRLRARGERILLVKEIQVSHLKRWTLLGILTTDIRDRALPWTALIQRTGVLPNDLNLDWRSRASALSVYALAGLVAAAPWWARARLLTALPLAILFICNRGLYGFFLRERGVAFLLGALPMHWLYFGYSSLAFAVGTLWYRTRGQRRGSGVACHTDEGVRLPAQGATQSAPFRGRRWL